MKKENFIEENYKNTTGTHQSYLLPAALQSKILGG